MGGKSGDYHLSRTICFDIMINYQLSQKLKLIGNDEFNRLTIILTSIKDDEGVHAVKQMYIFVII